MQTMMNSPIAPDAKKVSIKKPFIPAFFLRLGKEAVRRQADGTEVTFRVIELMREYPGVPSRFDGDEGSTWYTKEKMWMDVASLPTSSGPVS